MKKVAAVLAVAVMVVSLFSLAIAAEMKKGTVKAVDAKAGTITFTADGAHADVVLKADKSVDLGAVKAGEKVEISVEKDTVMSLKAAAPAAKRKAPVGC
jgi:cold shock CspA family protein